MTAAPQLAKPASGSPADRVADLLTWLENLDLADRANLAIAWAGVDATGAYTDVAGPATDLAYDNDLIIGPPDGEYVAGSTPRILLDRIITEYGNHVVDLLMAVLVADQITGEEYAELVGWARPYLPHLADFAPRRTAQATTWTPPVRRPWHRPRLVLRLAHLRVVAWLAVAAGTPLLWFLASVSLGAGHLAGAKNLFITGLVILIVGVVCGAVYAYHRTRAQTTAAAARRRAAQRPGATR